MDPASFCILKYCDSLPLMWCSFFFTSFLPYFLPLESAFQPTSQSLSDRPRNRETKMEERDSVGVWNLPSFFFLPSFFSFFLPFPSFLPLLPKPHCTYLWLFEKMFQGLQSPPRLIHFLTQANILNVYKCQHFVRHNHCNDSQWDLGNIHSHLIANCGS